MMLGFDAISALPIADDALSDDDTIGRVTQVITSGSNRLGSHTGGSEILSTSVGGGQPLQVN